MESFLFVLTFWFPELPSTRLCTLRILSHFIPYSNFCEVNIVLLSSLSYETSEAQRLINCLRTSQDSVQILCSSGLYGFPLDFVDLPLCFHVLEWISNRDFTFFLFFFNLLQKRRCCRE